MSKFRCPIHNHSDLEQAVYQVENSFEWGETREGFEFWRDVKRKLQRLLDDHYDAMNEDGECGGCVSSGASAGPIDYLSITKNVLGVPDK